MPLSDNSAANRYSEEATMTKVNACRLMLSAALAGAVLFGAAPAFAAQCNHKGGFNGFIADFKKEAAAKGVSKTGLAALDGITLDDSVLAADKRQHVFNQTFEQFSGRMISNDRLTKGARHMQQDAAMLKRIEQQFGVPSAVVVAICRTNALSTTILCHRRADKFYGRKVQESGFCFRPNNPVISS
jgi:membrane-bound lytic murein transglycosylase B